MRRRSGVLVVVLLSTRRRRLRMTKLVCNGPIGVSPCTVCWKYDGIVCLNVIHLTVDQGPEEANYTEDEECDA